MALTVNVTVDSKRLIESLKALGGKEALYATSRAVRRAAVSVQQEARKIAKAELNLNATPINQAIGTPGRASGSGDKVHSDVRISAKAIRLADYKGERQTNRGVTVQVHKGGPRKLLKGTFIATVGVGRHKGVFRRVGGRRGSLRGSIKAHKTYRPELPIVELAAKAVVQSFSKRERTDRLLEIARVRFNETMRQEYNHRLQRYQAKQLAKGNR